LAQGQNIPITAKILGQALGKPVSFELLLTGVAEADSETQTLKR